MRVSQNCLAASITFASEAVLLAITQRGLRHGQRLDKLEAYVLRDCKDIESAYSFIHVLRPWVIALGVEGCLEGKAVAFVIVRPQFFQVGR